MNGIRVMGASVPGTRHTLPGSPAWKNNQDAFAYAQSSDLVIAVICDGCSAGETSEVGAHLTAKHLVKLIADELRTEKPRTLDWKKIQQLLIAYLADVAEKLTTDELGTDVRSVIEHCFLCSIVGAIVTPDEIYIFSIGDGVWAIDGVFQTLGSFPDNKPPYLMYAVTGSEVTDTARELLDFTVQTFSDDSIRTVLIGTDGVLDMLTAHTEKKNYPGTTTSVGSTDRLFAPEFFENPDTLRRHLALMNRETVENGKIVYGLLPDDTTAVLIHRTERVETT